MSRKSDQEHMDRIRAARGLPPLRTQEDVDNLMERTRAAVCLLNADRASSEASKLSAFLSLFHPEIEPGTPQHLELMQDARARDNVR